MAKLKLKSLIPDKTNLLTHSDPQYIYAICFPELGLIKIGLATSNPWSRLRKVASSVRVEHDDRALTNLSYAIWGGHYQNEQEIHERFKRYRSYQADLMSPTEWFAYVEDVREWYEGLMQDVEEGSIKPRYVHLRKRAYRPSRQAGRKLYVPAG